MKIEQDDSGLYIATIQFQQRARFKADGWSWNDTLKRWTTRDRKKVIPFLAFCVGRAREALNQQIDAEKARIAPSLAADADIEIPVPLAFNIRTRKPYVYRPFQKAGIKFAAARENTLLADPPGLGKTIQAVGLSNYEGWMKRILLIVPAFLKVHWFRTWKEWDVKHLTVGVARVKAYQRDKIMHRENIWPDTQVVIVNPELLERFDAEIKAIEWDLVVVDECQSFSNSATLRAKCVYGGVYKVPVKKAKTGDKGIQSDTSEEEVVVVGDANDGASDPTLAPV